MPTEGNIALLSAARQGRTEATAALYEITDPT
jgi:hypothetical protein